MLLDKRKNKMGKREERRTDLESVKKYLETGEAVDDELPKEFLEALICRGLRLDLIQPGRIVFSINIPPRLLVRILSYLILTTLFIFFS